MSRSTFPGLKAWRESQGLDKHQLGEMLGVSPSTILRWENGGPVKIEAQRNALSKLMGGVAPVALDKPLAAPAVVPALSSVKRYKRVTTEEALTVTASDLAKLLGLPEGTAVLVFAPGADLEEDREAVGTPLTIKATIVTETEVPAL